MSTLVIDPTAKLQLRTHKGKLIAAASAQALLVERTHFDLANGEMLTYQPDADGPRVRLVSVQNETDRRPITGSLTVFATLSRLAAGRPVTVEVAG